MSNQIYSTTTDFRDFGIRELKEAGQILSAYKTQKDRTTLFSGDGVHIMMNKNSGYVFLTNDNYEVAMMNGDNLEDFITCPKCGHEDFLSEFESTGMSECCREYYKELS